MLEGLHKIVSAEETIVAVSTPLGRSGIGVIRISGEEALSIAARFFVTATGWVNPEHRRAYIGVWTDGQGGQMDEVVATVFRAPQSYTGENVVEISGHGNPIVLGRIVETVRLAGARIAKPGEFTLRAVMHGKIDLMQAESVREFIEAQTEQQAKAALRRMEGALSKRIRPAKEKLVDAIAHLEAGIDFAEDEIAVPNSAGMAEAVGTIAAELENLQRTFGYGRILSQGLRLAILGKPNVGKSSLFNCLVSTDRAIVADTPGTTRDVLTETVNMDGVPLRFADTAGLREARDHVERSGVMRALETLSDADLALVVLDGSTVLDDDDRQVLAKATGVPHIAVVNKSDLVQRIDEGALNGSRRVHVSAKTGQGLDDLNSAIRAFLLEGKTDLADDLVLTSARQHDALGRCILGLRAASDALAGNVPHEMVLLDLYQGLSALDELTGEVVTEDILSRIFSTFCVGK